MKMINEIFKCECRCGSTAILYKVRNMDTGEHYYLGICQFCNKSKRFDGFDADKIKQDFVKCFSKVK